MLLGKDMAPPAGQPSQNNADLSAALISEGRYSEAFRLLDRPGVSTVPELFNLALCHIYAADHSAALTRLDAALSGLRQPGIPAPPPETPARQKISAVQNLTETYMRPVTIEYIKLFPDVLQDSVLRLMVDCHAALGNWNKVVELGTPLARKGYGNVQKALAEAGGK